MADFSPSPAAQAVLDAYGFPLGGTDTLMRHNCRALAAALRAAADQVVPEQLENCGIRYELLRIATELEDFGG